MDCYVEIPLILLGVDRHPPGVVLPLLGVVLPLLGVDPSLPS